MRSSGTSFALLLMVPTTLATIHSDSFLERVKLTTSRGVEYCTCSFIMVLDGEKVDVERSKVICEPECSGDAEDVELEENGTNFYIVDAFPVLHGKGTIQGAIVILNPCDQTEKCTEAFLETGVKGFCSKEGDLGEGAECLPGDRICSFSGCSCCKECFDTTCSAKGEGWSCFSDGEAANLPKGSCVTDQSCSKSPGSPYKGACVCCKKGVTTTFTTTAIELGNSFCDTTRDCEDAYPGMGLRGFCGDKSLLGGDCSSSDQPGGNHLCQGEGCTCCKECLDKKCSAKGKGWSCFNTKSAVGLPEGSCVFDRSCSPAPDSPYEDSTCACCKPPLNPCEDIGCSKEWKGMGALVNVSSADWANVDANFNLSIPGIPWYSYCLCLKKKMLCADQGCSNYFNGAGVCLNALHPDFAATSSSLDFTAGPRQDLCAGFCFCFKKRNLNMSSGSGSA